MASDVQCALTHAVQALARRQRLSHAVRIFALACLVISIGMYFVGWGQLSYGLLFAVALPFLKQIPDRDVGRMVDETGQFTGAVECALDNRHRMESAVLAQRERALAAFKAGLRETMYPYRLLFGACLSFCWRLWS